MILVRALLASIVMLCMAPATAADIDAGGRKAQACVGCHGPGGNSAIDGIPSIAGQPAQAIATALYQFREGNRVNPQMSAMAANLSNADMNDLAAWFTAQPIVPAAHQGDPAHLAAGPALAERYHCVQCHGAALMGQQHIPRIAGQRVEYLVAQLRSFRAGTRADLDGNMTSAAQALSDSDIDVLSDWLASMHGP